MCFLKWNTPPSSHMGYQCPTMLLTEIKHKEQACVLGGTKIFTEWRACLSRYHVLMYTGSGGKEKDTYKLVFLPRLSNSSKNISKSTPPCRTDLLTSTNTVITKGSRVVCVQAVNTVQLMIVTDHSLTYGLIISINVKHQSARVTYVLQSK